MKQTVLLEKKKFSLTDLLWDLWCIISVVGIWPRFIEPNLLQVTKLHIQIPNLPKDLEGLKILQFSDIHLNQQTHLFFLNKLIRKINKLKPDIIVFVGDFLCYSELKDQERLQSFLCSLSAPHGCFAVLGNHDYSQCVSINKDGEYDVIEKGSSQITQGFSRLFSNTKLAKAFTNRIKNVPLNEQLLSLIKKTPFELLHNSTKIIPFKGSHINLCGLGEYTLGRSLPQQAFQSYNPQFPGIVLAHNPDSIPGLQKYPGDLILCGHTHGGQVNLPWMWKKFTLLENMQYKHGLLKENDKWIYISRGVGSVMPFRWFAMPEIVFITL
jgi:uncharacterized protein